MKSKKTAKQKKDDIKVIVRYGISVPEKDLFKIIKFDAADLLDKFFTENKVAGRILDIIEPVINVIKDAQLVWASELLPYIKSGKSPADEKWTKKPTACPVKPSPAKKPTLSKEEKETIQKLRKGGKTIKAIAKAIHRSDKAIAGFIHIVDKGLKKAK